MRAPLSTDRRPVNGRHDRGSSRRIRRFAAAVLATLAATGVPALAAGAEAAPPPEPTKLWRNFPLEAQNANAAERARTEPAASAPEPTRRPTTGEARDRSHAILRIALAILAGALVALAIMGILVFAELGKREHGIERRRRRREWSFRDFVDTPRPAVSARRPGGTVGSAFRRANRRAKDDVNTLGEAATALSERVVAEVRALKTGLGASMARVHEKATAVTKPSPPRLDDGAGARKREAATQPPPVAKVTRDSDSARTPADDELEILKAKLGKPARPVDGEQVDDIERLKVKLARDAGVNETGTPDTSLLKTKLADPAAAVEPLARESTEVAALRVKLELKARSTGGQRESAPDIDADDGALHLSRERRAEDPGPTEPRTTSGAARRRARRRGRRSSNRANGSTRVTPLPHGELTRPRSERRDPAVAPPPLPLGRASAARCRITWWRGYWKSAFCAVVRTPSGEEQVLAESPQFRWNKPDPPPKSSPAVEAHRALVEALRRDGWSVASTGKEWFMLELERPHRPGRAENGADENERGGM